MSSKENNAGNFTAITKQSKKAQKEFHASQRTVIGFNTGTRFHKTDKHPSRARSKELAKKAAENQ